MAGKQHVVRLSATQRAELTKRTNAGVGSARMLTRARILLLADAAGGGRRWTDRQIAEALGVSARTVARARATFVREGVDRALTRRRPRITTPRRLDGVGEAYLIATACSPAPAGRARWTLQLLADQLVALAVVPGICPETVRTTLKKTSSSRG